jgi:ethanolamine utilization protein EutA
MVRDRSSRFSDNHRDILGEDRIRLTSVGVDIGSSTSHLVFSRLELELQQDRYVMVERTVLKQSDILLTPYRDATTIDGEALETFVEQQYAAAGLSREDVDTGALILTGVALQRDNARAIGELFADEAGRFVAVTAGDNLEAILAAHGSGAIDLSSDGRVVVNVDVGGGTTKVVVCHAGRAVDVAVLDVGARLIATDPSGVINRLEPTGVRIGQALGVGLRPGETLSVDDRSRMASFMASQVALLLQRETPQLLRTAPLTFSSDFDALTVSGGVSEFFYGREARDFGDLGPQLAAALRSEVEALHVPIATPRAGIRATVIGASQYTLQLSGSTIFISPSDAVPIRNVPVIAPNLDLQLDGVDSALIRLRINQELQRFDLQEGDSAVALAVRWSGSATYGRISAFCRGVVDGMQPILAQGHPLVLVYDHDIGGLLGIHFKEEVGLPNAVVSVDSVDLQQFDYIDIGALIPASGAVPVVIKSLVFPGAARVTHSS